VSWRISYTRTAARAIRDLDPEVRMRVRAAIDRLTEDPSRGKPLRLTLKGLRTWRTGDWRIVYRATRQTLEILVVAVGHRRDVYDRVRDRLRS
jgi:mRNA interferase RelE/StbE